MISALLGGAVVGLGVLLVWRGATPATVPLNVALRSVERAPGSGDAGSAFDRFGNGLVPLVESLGLSLDRLRADLDITGRTLNRHLAEKVFLAIFGVCLVSLVSVALGFGGLHLSFGIPLWMALIVGAAFFFVPDGSVRSEAASQRRQFRRSLGSFLDLVAISLAGGAGVESALEDAATRSRGSAGPRLRAAMRAARLRGETPWVALGRLGESLRISELVELAACVGLAGVEGARVRETLAAKAGSLRSHQLSEAEAEAQGASEQMSLPVVVLFAAFIVFLGFPGIDRVLAI